MSTTNPSPCFKGLGQRTTRAVEGSSWGMQVAFWEMDRRFDMADGKVQAYYHEQLEELKWDLETLQEKLT